MCFVSLRRSFSFYVAVGVPKTYDILVCTEVCVRCFFSFFCFVWLITLGDMRVIIVFIVYQCMVFIIKINNIHKALLETADMCIGFLHK